MSKVKEKLRVLIVDDEELARARVRRLLSAHLHIEVVGEASGLLEAVAAYNSLRPDLIFLDIEMPDGRGFELFDRCEVGCPVIFVTAYDQHAVRAFEVNALDYLLKPIEANRLRQSLERFATLAQPAPTGSGCRGGDRVAIRADGALHFVALDDIAYVESAGDYTEVHACDGRSWLCSTTMKEWETRLGAELFFRIHRSTLVALAGVSELLPTAGSTHALRLRGVEQDFGVSRSALRALRDALEALDNSKA